MLRIARRIFLVSAIVGVLVATLLACGYGYERYAEYRDWQRFPPPGKLVDVDGRKLHLNCQGNGTPTVVIETSAGGASFRWWQVQEMAAKSMRVCTHDRPGLGWSEAAPMGRSIEDRASHLHQVLTKGGISGPYIIVAHSYGALIALRFVREHRDEVAGMVLVDAADEEFVYTPAFLQAASIESAALKKLARATRFGMSRISLVGMTNEEKAKSLGVSRALLDRIGLTAAGLSPRYGYEYADEMNSFLLTPIETRHSGASGSLGNLPLIVLKHGRPFVGSLAAMEQEWSEAQNRLTKLSQHSELIVAHNSGHEIFRDEPEIVVGAIRRILDERVALPH